MAKNESKLQQTKGFFKVAGIVSGVKRDDFSTEKMTQGMNPKLRKAVKFAVQTSPTNKIYVTLGAQPAEKVYFSKRSEVKGEKSTVKAVDWDARHTFKEDGYSMIGVRVGLTKKTDSDGKEVNDTKTMTPYDAVDYIKENLKDEMSVFIKGHMEYSRFEDRKIMVCEGSGRNYGKFELEDFRGFLKSTNLFNYVDGHSNAFGFGFNLSNMENILEVCNRELAKYKIDYTHKVDFTVRFEELDDMVFYEADRLQELWGQKVEEPQFAILDIDVELKKIEVSKNGAAVKFEADGITFIRFTADSEDILLKIRNDWEYEGASVKIDVVGKLGVSSYGGVKSRQVIVSDWAVSEKNKAG